MYNALTSLPTIVKMVHPFACKRERKERIENLGQDECSFLWTGKKWTIFLLVTMQKSFNTISESSKMSWGTLMWWSSNLK